MTYKEIVQKIIDLLKVNANLKYPDVIKQYCFGEPVSPPLDYPWIYVQWDGQRRTEIESSSQYTYELTFEIGVVDRAASEDEAEKSVYDKVEYVKDVLKGNPTLDGLVLKDALPFEVTVVRSREEDYAVAYAQILFPRRLQVDAF